MLYLNIPPQDVVVEVTVSIGSLCCCRWSRSLRWKKSRAVTCWGI